MQKSIDTLTSLRFVAAFGVFVHHLNRGAFGPVSVTFFFVLSGFVMTYVYHSRIDSLKDSNGIVEFYIARFSRIYPVVILTLLIAIPVFLHETNQGTFAILSEMMTQVLLIQSYSSVNDVFYSFNGVAWSISTEMFFYLLFPFALQTIVRRNLKILHLSIILTVLFAIEFLIAWNFKDHTSGNAAAYWFLYISPFFRFLDFSCGMIIGMMYLGNKKGRFWPGFELVSILLLVFVYFTVRYAPESLVYGVYYVPFVCLVVFTFAHQRGIFSKVLSMKSLVYLGEVSFSFYMIHQLTNRYFWGYFQFSPPTIIGYLCVFTISLSASIFMYQFYEFKMRNYIKKKLTKRYREWETKRYWKKKSGKGEVTEEEKLNIQAW